MAGSKSQTDLCTGCDQRHRNVSDCDHWAASSMGQLFVRTPKTPKSSFGVASHWSGLQCETMLPFPLRNNFSGLLSNSTREISKVTDTNASN